MTINPSNKNDICSSRTLFDDEIDDHFLIPIRNKPKPTYKRNYASNYFLINTADLSHPKYRLFFCELNDHYIFLRENENSDHVAVMDIIHAIIRKSESPVTIKQEQFYSLKFIKKQNFEELFVADKAIIDDWFELLKCFCRKIEFRNDFRKVHLLGQGNFAKVFLVERKSDLKKFAAKMFVKKPFLADEFERKCLKYEIEIMRTVNHPKVLKLFEIFEGEKFIYLICELYQGRDLWAKILDKGAQSEPKALIVLQQLLEALFYLHSLKIIHRDVKPENVLFRSSKNITQLGLVDLGFSTYEKDYKKLFVRCGTPGYVAPEVLDDKPYNCKADMYSAGVIFHLLFFYKTDGSHAIQRRNL